MDDSDEERRPEPCSPEKKCGRECFQFNSLTEKSEQQFSKKALPPWRRTKEGMSMCGKCINQDCLAGKLNDWVWVSHQFGIFNIAKLKFKSFCPSCKKVLPECNNISFSMCTWDIDGKRKDGTDFNEKGVVAEPGKYITFKQGKQVEWEFLEINVQELQKK